ncbi:MAG: spore coat U domain-containing protein [Terracidiphilus sp.]
MKHSCFVKLAMSAALIGFLALGLAPVASANTATNSFTVSATVVTACTVTATNMAFGTVVPSASLATYTSTQSAITVTCTSGDPYTVALTAGLGTGATETSRYMMSGTTNKLAYALFNDSTRLTNWGTLNGYLSESGSGTAQVWPVYGQISAQTAPPTGSYTDTITVNVTY